jgi:hypothetical protein
MGKLHLGFAALFFFTIAYISFFQFTKGSGTITPAKRMRNKIYRACGTVIIAAIILIGLYFWLDLEKTQLKSINPVFILETIALLAFGISWLTKGRFLQNDD